MAQQHLTQSINKPFFLYSVLCFQHEGTTLITEGDIGVY